MEETDIVLKDIPERCVAYLTCKGPWRQLPDMITSLVDYMALKGMTPLGPPCGLYFNTPGEVAPADLSWQVHCPIGPAALEGPDAPGRGVRKLAAGRVASLVHVGSYRKTAPSYERLQGWLQARGIESCGPSEEVYFSDIRLAGIEPRIEIRLPVCRS